MRKIIDGKVYDTATAKLLCDISVPGLHSGDFEWDDTGLYWTQKGTYFVSGCGGPRSRWAESPRPGEYRSGDGLYIIEAADARDLCELHCTVSEYEALFGVVEEG